MNVITETSKFTVPEVKEGETYIGAIIKADGTGNHIILLPGDNDDANWQAIMDWQAAMDWAKSIGGDLPDRVEQALMFSDHKDLFKVDWCWSNTQHAPDASCAWFQSFIYGRQNHYSKSAGLRARAVRRLPI